MAGDGDAPAVRLTNPKHEARQRSDAPLLIIFIAALLVPTYMIYRGHGDVPLLVVTVILMFVVFIYLKVWSTRPETMTIDGSEVRLHRGARLVQRFPLGPEVEVEMLLAESGSHPTPGSLSGFLFSHKHWSIRCWEEDGWSLEEIQRALPDIVEVVRRHGLRVGPLMKEYLDAD